MADPDRVPERRRRIGVRETFGLVPFRKALADARLAVAGSPYTSATRFGLSSVRIFKPRISLPTWLGRRRRDRLAPLYNFVNRNLPPRGAPFSVRVTDCRDFRGGRWTYDGHIGTDFAIPVGTPVVAAAPGVVLRVANEIDRGGLKVCVDHGEGLFHTYSHLSRALVGFGERVGRGRVLGLSGASGIEFLLFFPWVAPHLHLNVWLGGDPADPFARPGETPLWRTGNDPRPFDGKDDPADADFAPSDWDPDGVDAAIGACRDPELRASMRAFDSLPRRAAEVLFMRNLRGSTFDAFPPLYRGPSSRRPVLDLPFRGEDFEGVAFPDDGFGRGVPA